MSERFDTIVTAIGSLGDVNPLLAIARIAQADGRRVLFMAAERYLPLAERAGLATRSIVDEAAFKRMVDNPRLWHPRQGVKLIFGEAVSGLFGEHFQWLQETCQRDRPLLISHVLDFAGRILRDLMPELRLVSVLPAPALLRSFDAPPRLTGFSWERRIPKAILPTLYRYADWYVDRVAAPPINAQRQKVGLPAVRRVLDRWWWSPDAVWGLFPDWFTVPTERDGIDCLPQLRHLGFPLADSADVVSESARRDLSAALEFCARERPVLFAPGTAHHQAYDYLAMAVAACQRLGRSAILISTDPNQFPSVEGQQFFKASYLPFSEVLPHVATVVHHGGVGTTSQALAAGCPQVVLPMAFDQFDNAERVEKLECGSWLPMRKLTVNRLLSKLEGLPASSVGMESVQKRVQSLRFEAAVRSSLAELLSN